MDIRQVRRRQQADAAARRANIASMARSMNEQLDEDVAFLEATDWCCDEGEVSEGSEHSSECPEFATG